MPVQQPSEITIQAIMHPNVLSCDINDSIQQAAKKMHAQNASSIIVIEDEIPIGIWTEFDALKLDFSIPTLLSEPIKNFMSVPVKTIHQQEFVSNAALVFQQQEIRHFIVVDDNGDMQGIISQSDIVFHQSPESFLHVKKIKKVLDQEFLSLDKSLSITTALSHINKSSVNSMIVTGFADFEFGIITERDIIHLISSGCTSCTLEEIVNKPLLTISSEQSIIEAQQMLLENNIRHLGVINEEDNVIGILTFEHLLKGIQYEYVNYLEGILKQRDDALLIANKNLLLAHSVIESTKEGIMVVDTDGKIEMVNPAFTNVTGYTEQEVIGKNPNILRSDRHRSSG